MIQTRWAGLKQLQREILQVLGLVGVSNLLLLSPEFRGLGAIALSLFLAGWGWARLWLWGNQRPAPRLTLAVFSAAFSTGWAMLLGLALFHLPGRIGFWQIWLGLHLITLTPLIPLWFFAPPKFPPSETWVDTLFSRHTQILLILLVLAGGLRLYNLGYSEFQGDEGLAMVVAAETLGGTTDSLFTRSKGPGEVLLPLVLWRLNGVISEGLARVPFSVAALGSFATLYLLGLSLFRSQTERENRIGLYALGFLAASGFTVGFGRIVQYQMLVIWFSALAVFSAWQWRELHARRWAFASGLFLGLGLLAHYDALLAVPAIAWVWVEQVWREQRGGAKHRWHFGPLALWLLGFGVAVSLFYPPYLLDPQAVQTGSYLGDRIGPGLLKNNLPDFFHFNTFYSSFYYVILLGGLWLAFFGWAMSYFGRSVAALSVGGLVGLTAFNLSAWWLGGLWAVALLAAFASPGLRFGQRVAWVWFAGTFWGYNFAVELPLTHIYTILPAWVLLSAWVAGRVHHFSLKENLLPASAWVAVNGGLILLSVGYLSWVYLTPATHFVADYPASNPALYLTPYEVRPVTGYFGFPYRAGWKSVGALVADGTLTGDYDSNTKEAVTAWYTRHAPRSCNEPEFYFLAGQMAETYPLNGEPTDSTYAQVGYTQIGEEGLDILQVRPVTLDLGQLDEATLAQRFTETAYPEAFQRQFTGDIPAEANFGGLIRLRGYDVDLRRAYPGGRIPLTLYWEALAPMTASYKIFVQLDPQEKYAQADSIPYCATFPTNLWRPGQLILDHRVLNVAPDTPPGQHPLEIGWYNADTGQRLDVLDVAGNPAGVSVTLTELEVGR